MWEPIGRCDASAPPKKHEPTKLGYSVAAARERCLAMARQHQQRRTTGGLRQVKTEEAEAFKTREAALADRATRTLRGLLDTYPLTNGSPRQTCAFDPMASREGY